MSIRASVEEAVLRALEVIFEEIESGRTKGELSRKAICQRAGVSTTSVTRNPPLAGRVSQFLKRVGTDHPELVSKHGRTGHVEENVRRVLADLEHELLKEDDFDGRLSLREICRRAGCDPAALRRHPKLKGAVDDFIAGAQRRTTTTVATTTQRRKDRIRQLEREITVLAAHVVSLEAELKSARAQVTTLQNAKPDNVVTRDVFGRPR